MKKYKHKGGTIYEVIGETVSFPNGDHNIDDMILAFHHETQESMVFPVIEGAILSTNGEMYAIYQSTEDGRVWARERDNFHELVLEYGKLIKRFTPLLDDADRLRDILEPLIGMDLSSVLEAAGDEWVIREMVERAIKHFEELGGGDK